jgi:N utilization substance protein B
MGKRRDGRLAAVQYLFAHEVHGNPSIEERAAFWDLHSIKGQARDFAETLINGVLASRDEIDVQIKALIENYSFERLATVDRNVLRLAAYELAHASDVPAAVILNEAIEVAKMLSAGESGSFVNGILHKLAHQIRPPAATTASTPATTPPVTPLTTDH